MNARRHLRTLAGALTALALVCSFPSESKAQVWQRITPNVNPTIACSKTITASESLTVPVVVTGLYYTLVGGGGGGEIGRASGRARV